MHTVYTSYDIASVSCRLDCDTAWVAVPTDKDFHADHCITGVPVVSTPQYPKDVIATYIR